jgi:hypothetical protein
MKRTPLLWFMIWETGHQKEFSAKQPKEADL